MLATITGVVIVALTTSSGDSFEDAGRTDVGEAGSGTGFAEGSRRPNEIRDPALESLGIPGTIEDLPPALATGDFNGKTSQNIGYRPYCPPWEYLTKGPNEEGEYEYDPTAADNANIGGPDGAGGVFSSKIGCFAPCYIEFLARWGGVSERGSRSGPNVMTQNYMHLHYFDDNRPPPIRHIRVGINYYRSPITTPSILANLPNPWNTTDINQVGAGNSKDGKPIIIFRGRTDQNGVLIDHGNTRNPGIHPIPPEILADGVPYVFIPNFKSTGDDPAKASGDLTDRNGSNNHGPWADENWEWRADPINKTCTIVNVTQDDRIVCTSTRENCRSVT